MHAQAWCLAAPSTRTFHPVSPTACPPPLPALPWVFPCDTELEVAPDSAARTHFLPTQHRVPGNHKPNAPRSNNAPGSPAAPRSGAALRWGWSCRRGCRSRRPVKFGERGVCDGLAQDLTPTSSAPLCRLPQTWLQLPWIWAGRGAKHSTTVRTGGCGVGGDGGICV